MLSERNTLVHRLRMGRKVIGFSVSRIAADEGRNTFDCGGPSHRGRGLSNTLC